MIRHFSILVQTLAASLPIWPAAVFAWEPGIGTDPNPVVPVSGFTVLNQHRNDVVAFWQAVYQASEGYEKRIKWTGNYSGKPGTVSKEFTKDVARRINYFRAMCNLPSDVRVNTGSTVFRDVLDAYKPAADTLKSEAAQAAALMLILNYDPHTGTDPAISHNPVNSLKGWSKEAWNGNAHGNLAFGMFGPGAITEYMMEELSNGSATSSWNSLVGHRRWMLFPESTDFATGDQPGSSAMRPPTNVLYIAQKDGELNDVDPAYVSYPPPGFFPALVNSKFWSLSHPGADFNSATVKVTDSDGNQIPVSEVSPDGSYGHPALVWQVGGAAAAKSVYADKSFNVSVTGIGGEGVPSSCSYSVTLINPGRILSNQAVSGPATASAVEDTIYQFTPPSMAEAIQLSACRRMSSPWSEGAESKSGIPVIDGTSDTYPLKVKMAAYGGFGQLAGPNAFRLTFPVSYDLILRGVPDQSFELDRTILSRGNGKLKFLYRRGYMTKGSFLDVEVSANGGVTWSRIGKSIRGVNNTTYDSSVSTALFDLPKTKQALRVRFRYHTKPGEPIYTHEATPSFPTGIFIDNITTKNCDWLAPKKNTLLGSAANQISFNQNSAGEALTPGSKWSLAIRTKLGGKWFPPGPLKSVKVTKD